MTGARRSCAARGRSCMRLPHSLLVFAAASFAVSTAPRLLGDAACDEINGQIERRRVLQDQLQSLQAVNSVWVEYALEADLGDVPRQLANVQAVRDACRSVILALNPEYAERPSEVRAPVERCVKRLTPPSDRIQILKDIKAVHTDIADMMARVKDELGRALPPLAELHKKLNALHCGDNDEWKKLIGRWRNSKATLVLDFVDAGSAIEGRVVKALPDWPPNIVAGTVFFRSSVTPGESASGRMNGNTLQGSFRNFPQGKDCPNLAREPKYDPGTIEIGSGAITLHQNGRYYSASTCRWADKMFAVTTPMTPAQ